MSANADTGPGRAQVNPLHAIAAGFAVVKKGRDKRTGDPVAIKVGQEQGLQRKWEARNKLPAVFLSPGGGQVALRCGRQQLGARDSSAVQGASCLTACYVHVRHLQGPDRAGPACMPGGSPALHQALRRVCHAQKGVLGDRAGHGRRAAGPVSARGRAGRWVHAWIDAGPG